MANQLIDQGSLNRLKASIVMASYPALNVTTPYLGKEAISIATEGQATTLVDTMTGGVISPEPYMRVTVTIHLLRTQALANAWKAQMEFTSLLGQMTVYPDSVQQAPYQLFNTNIMALREQRYDGTDPGFVISIGGYYYINSVLYS